MCGTGDECPATAASQGGGSEGTGDGAQKEAHVTQPADGTTEQG